jgi:hypothetical protein
MGSAGMSGTGLNQTEALDFSIRKPFDIVANGLISQQSRGNWTSFELFLGPFRAWKQADWQLATECNL